ncbi:MAG: hypothetical protein JSV88_10770 [Candidatus Aminicenantes bacterium]|nr:MAG: hypothetical protein JSV88_10770 [Candidatus Aminicenantes bacterium]
MYDSQENKSWERGRNLLIVLSLVFSILFFWTFSSLSTTGNHGVVTTSVTSVRIGDMGIETGGIAANMVKTLDSKSTQKMINP